MCVITVIHVLAIYNRFCILLNTETCLFYELDSFIVIPNIAIYIYYYFMLKSFEITDIHIDNLCIYQLNIFISLVCIFHSQANVLSTFSLKLLKIEFRIVSDVIRTTQAETENCLCHYDTNKICPNMKYCNYDLYSRILY